MELKEKILALEKLAAQFNKALTGLAKEQGIRENGEVETSASQKETLERMKTDILAEIKKANPSTKKMVFGGDDPLKDNEMRVAMNKWLIMVKYNHPSLAKTVMSEGDNAQGGYTVLVGYASQIIGELNQATSIVPKCTPFPHGQADGPVKYIPKWLTDLSVAWIAEATAKTTTKPTLTRLTSTLKKMYAIVTFTDEYLSDDTAGIAAQVAKLVGENMAVELERVILIGDVAGAGDAFNGIYYSTPSTVTQAGVSLAYQDIVNIWNNPNVNSKYLKGKPEWTLNKTSLGLIMNLVDNNGRPLWNLGSLSAGIPPNILGDPYNISQQITNTLGAGSNASAIFYGDFKYVLLGNKSGGQGITVDVSNSAVISSDSSPENLWTQDETGYRFVKRAGVLVAMPLAFSVGIEIK